MSAASDQLKRFVLPDRCDCPQCETDLHALQQHIGALREETVTYMREHGVLRTYEWINEHG